VRRGSCFHRGVTSIIVRKLEAAEREAVATLWGSVFGYGESRNDPARVLAAKLAWDERVLVAVEDGAILGSIMVGFDGHRGWLYRMAVASAARRRGIGSLLVRAAEAELAALGCAKVNVQLHANNADAQAFWRALGYEVEPRVSMGKELSVSARPDRGQ
jgi:ribosomal protein S18 acetylase RimI-like enzyme